MADNRGKQFENRFREDWKRCFPESFILRLPDQQSGYYGTSKNICDFICFANKTLFLIECKTHAGNTFPLTNYTQYNIMKSYNKIDNVIVGVVIWMYDKDVVVFIAVDEVTKMKNDDIKSFNVKMLEDENCPYNIIIIPSKKKKVFMESDYTIFKEMTNGD